MAEDIYLSKTGISEESLKASGVDSTLLDLLKESYDHTKGDFGADFMSLYNRPALLSAIVDIVAGYESQVASRERLYKLAMKHTREAREEITYMKQAIAGAFLKAQKTESKSLRAENRRLREIVFELWMESLHHGED